MGEVPHVDVSKIPQTDEQFLAMSEEQRRTLVENIALNVVAGLNFVMGVDEVLAGVVPGWRKIDEPTEYEDLNDEAKAVVDSFTIESGAQQTPLAKVEAKPAETAPAPSGGMGLAGKTVENAGDRMNKFMDQAQKK